MGLGMKEAVCWCLAATFRIMYLVIKVLSAISVGPYDFNLFTFSDEEKKRIQGLPKSLGEALDALEADHAYLTAGFPWLSPFFVPLSGGPLTIKGAVGLRACICRRWTLSGRVFYLFASIIGSGSNGRRRRKFPVFPRRLSSSVTTLCK